MFQSPLHFNVQKSSIKTKLNSLEFLETQKCRIESGRQIIGRQIQCCLLNALRRMIGAKSTTFVIYRFFKIWQAK